MSSIESCESCIFFEACINNEVCDKEACCCNCIINGFICDLGLNIIKNNNRELVCSLCGKISDMGEFRRLVSEPVCKICYSTSEGTSGKIIKNNFCEKYQVRCICSSCKTPCTSNSCENCWIEKGLKPPEARNCPASLLEEKKYTVAHQSLKDIKSKIHAFFEELYLINSLIESNKEIDYGILKNQFKKANIDLLIEHNYLTLSNNTVTKGMYYLNSILPKKILSLGENTMLIDLCIYASLYDVIKLTKFKQNGIDAYRSISKLIKFGLYKKLKNKKNLYTPHSWLMAQLKKITANYSFEKLQADELIKVFAIT